MTVTNDVGLERCAGRARPRRRESVDSAAADFWWLEHRRRRHAGLFSCCVAFFMVCMISIQIVVKYFSLTIHARVAKFDFR